MRLTWFYKVESCSDNISFKSLKRNNPPSSCDIVPTKHNKQKHPIQILIYLTVFTPNCHNFNYLFNFSWKKKDLNVLFVISQIRKMRALSRGHCIFAFARGELIFTLIAMKWSSSLTPFTHLLCLCSIHLK